MLDIDIKNVDRALHRLSKHQNKTTERIQKRLEKDARNMVLFAKRKVPVGSRVQTRKTKFGRVNVPTGQTKRSIRKKAYYNKLHWSVYPKKHRLITNRWNGWKRHWIEHGTKDRYTKKGAYRGKMPQIPFMKPAENQYRKKSYIHIANILKEEKII